LDPLRVDVLAGSSVVAPIAVDHLGEDVAADRRVHELGDHDVAVALEIGGDRSRVIDDLSDVLAVVDGHQVGARGVGESDECAHRDPGRGNETSDLHGVISNEVIRRVGRAR
jgi:hypothetical protein